MNTNQPVWRLIANLGDNSPIDYGGFFVYRDRTGVYPAEGELLESPLEDESGEPWRVYRFTLERCTFVDGILSDNKFHPGKPAWFAAPESARAERPQDTTYLSNVADFTGQSAEELTAAFCSADACERAQAYRAVGEYHGFENLDSHPLEFSSRAEVNKRYRSELRTLRYRREAAAIGKVQS